jgi:3'-phosphoadenosine 5'-phosphosulfate sulfotransferase (PAPS reductase)/FAD synthetase
VKHIVSYSGGIGSWMTAKRVIEQYGKENVLLVFTDTKIEDSDLYRFIDETVKEMECDFVYLADGRTPWEVFKDKRFIGNSRLAHCSHVLKQDIFSEWLHSNYQPDECVLYLGIDWTESHRKKKPIESYALYRVEFPMCEEPYLTKDDMIEELNKIGIKTPSLYELGFSHNNCGGFCVRAGQGHFAHLLKMKPDLYKHHEEKEQEMREFLGKDYSILKRTKTVWKNNKSGGRFKDREIHQLTLKQLRKEIESENTKDVDFQDIGGCGCFVDSD